MATLILTTLGSALGGPVGGAIGALAGQAIDAQIFKPGGRNGPRLSDLQVQTSRYGARIPKLYGAIRVAGTVIWSTDLQESSATDGGKGQPSVTSYSYSASFAVALSARAIGGIGRIWADGNLLRGAAGDFKTPLGAFRLHAGGEDQAVDPLIAADVGIDQAPAYRRCAYVVLEGLQLADFGNRIPSLTFEVFADEAAVGVSTILSDLAGAGIAYSGDADEPVLGGFAAEGGDLREAMGDLIELHDLIWRERDGVLALVAGTWVDRSLEAGRGIRRVDGETQPADLTRRVPLETVPVRLAIRHHDPDRDYQIGIQSAERPGAGQREASFDLPAVLSADDARRIADRKLRLMQRGRTTARRSADWTALDLVVGDVVALGGEPGRWLVERADWDDMVVRLSLRAVETGGRDPASAGESGGPVRQPDRVQGATSLAILELPPDGDVLASAPVVRVVATGADAGWRRAALFRYQAGTESAVPIGRTAPRAVLGMTATVLGEGVSWRIDRRSSVDVTLDNVADALISIDDAALIQGGNLCHIGEESLQFGVATPIGPHRYRLSHLIRGWHGTEWACAGHATDERFVLIDPARLAPVEASVADVARSLELRAIGSGDGVPAAASRIVDGRAMLPLAPVHGGVSTLTDGDVSIHWVRRSRLGWTWIDGRDAPVGEEDERYLVRVIADGVALRAWEVVVPLALYAAGDRAADALAAGGAALRIEVRQLGIWGLGRPLALDLP